MLGLSEPAVVPSESWTWTDHGVVVEPTTNDSPFRAGDLVAAIDGIPLETWVGSSFPLAPQPAAGPAQGTTTRRFGVVRDGRDLEISAALVPYPLERLVQVPLGLIAFGAGVLALALALLVRKPRSTVVRLLFVGAAANVADIVPWSLGVQPTDFLGGSVFLACFAAAAVFDVLFWATIVHILTIYPTRSPLALRRPNLIGALYIVPLGGLVVVALAWRVTAPTTLEWVGGLSRAMGAISSLMLVAIVGATVAGYRRAGAAIRASVRIVALTLVFAACATLVLLTGPIAVEGRPLLGRGVVDLLAIPVVVALVAAILRDRLFQVALLTRSRERVVAAREDERRKLRRDLHDGLAPTLAAAGLKLDLARQSVRSDPDAAERIIDEVRHGVRETIGEIRRLSRELRPPAIDSLGVVGAVRQQADELGSRGGNGPVIIVRASAPLPQLPAAVEVAAYRIAVEGMMNVVRHAAATTCEVRIELVGSELMIEVTDDGTGIAMTAGGVGTRSMLERAAEVGGDVRIVEGSGSGTRLLARLPVEIGIIGGARQ